jgi:hypothetical protein
MSIRTQLKHSNVLILLGFGLLMAASVILAQRIYFSYNFEDFFPKGDPELDFYYAFREKFEHDDSFFMIGFQKTGGVFEQNFLIQLDSATRQINRLDDVERATSITNFRYFVKTPFGYIDYPAIHLDDSARYTADKDKLLADERIKGKLLNADATITIIYLKTADSIAQNESTALVSNIRTVLVQNQLTEHHLLGKAYFQSEIIQLQQKEFFLYSFLSVLLVAIVTWLLFRRWTNVLLCLMNVAVTMLLFTGFCGLLRVPFNALSTLYPIVLIIVGISDIIHILTGYIFEIRKGKTPGEAIAITKKEIGFATLLTAITTAIGFLTLITSKVEPIMHFSMLSAAGVMIAYIVSFYFTANIIPYINEKKLMPPQQKDNGRWLRLITFFYGSGIKHTKWVYTITVILLVTACFGILKVSTNTHIGAGLPKHSTIRADYDFFDTYFNGFRPFEIAALAQDTFLVTDLEVLKQIDAVENYVSRFDIVHGLQSTTVIYKTLNRAYNGDVTEAYTLPASEADMQRYTRDLEKMRVKETHILMSEDKKCGRITANLADVGTDSIRAMLHDINKFILDNTDTSKVKFIQTGTGIIFDRNTLYLRQNLINGLCFGFIPISLLIALFYRNWKMFFIASIPNLFPLLVCAGIIGFAGIELDAPTSIIFGIIYGIAVDDTIHFLSRFRQEIKKGTSKEEAIYITFHETGKAIFSTTLILMFGFSVLMLSGTAATFNIGFLTAVTLCVAAVSDVYLLPLLLRRFL